MLCLTTGIYAMQTYTTSAKASTTRATNTGAKQRMGWTGWLFPKPFTVVATLLYIGILALYFRDRLFGTNVGQPQWNEALAAGAVLGLLLIDRIEYRFFGDTPPTRIAAGLLLLRVVLIEVIAQLDQFSFSPVLYLIVPFYASLYFGMKPSYYVAGIVALAYVAKLTWYQSNWYEDEVILRDFLVFAVGLLFVLTMARVVRNEKTSRARAELLLADLEASHKQLQAYSDQVAELAATRERNAMARDIHDSLGHYLTVVNVQLEKALAYRDKKPGDADRAVASAKRLAAEALQNVRYSVSTLRGGEQFSLKSGLDNLVEDVRGTKLQIELKWHGSESACPTETLIALYRTAQEALTNVQKHADATHVEIELSFDAEAATLSITDNGRGINSENVDSRQPGLEGGYGLIGIRERLEMVGGTLQVSGTPVSGTTLLVQVPCTQVQPIEGTI